MTAFIHGEISWTATLDEVRADVERMLSAVEHYPWVARTVTTDTTPTTRCVLAVQTTGPRPSDRIEAPGRLLVGDLQLHARDELGKELDVPADEVVRLDDDELVLLAYRRWGTQLGAKLLGDGVFALWDSTEQRLHCWRDATGARPLYYHHEPGRRFVFSSDLLSLVAHPAVPDRLDLAYARALLRYRAFQHRTRTIVDGVQKLAAAHTLTVGPTTLRLDRYWDPPDTEGRPGHIRPDAEYVEEARELVRIAVRCRLPRDGGAVGAHLSGGLDSSSIAVVAAAEAAADRRAVTGFSWAPPWDVVPELDGDERPLAEAASRFGGVPLRFTRLRAADIADLLEPDSALRPRWMLHVEGSTSRDAVAEHVTTMLSGWGGDELLVFNGRGYFADLARRGRFATIQRELRLRAAVHGGSLAGAWKNRVLTPLLSDRVLQLLGWAPGGPPTALPGELRPDFARALEDVEPLETELVRERVGVHRMQRTLFEHGALQYRMEAWAGHGASLGLRYSFPMLDRRLVEFALTVPDHLYFQRGWKRWLYRTAMEGVLPDEVRWNPDKFDTAMREQIRLIHPDLSELYRERLADRRDHPLVDVSHVFDERGSANPSLAADGSNNPVGAATWLAFTRLRPA